MAVQVQDKNFEQCMKCSVCTAYCPVTLVNPKFPGPKQSGPDGERYRLKDLRYFDKSLDYCLNCKRCEVACPSDVKIADIIEVVRYRHASSSPSFRNRLLAETDKTGMIAGSISSVTNALLKNKTFKKILDSTLNIDQRRVLPHYDSTTFRKWYQKKAATKQQQFKNKVSYFHGCYVNYNYPKLGMDLIKILNVVGIGVELLDEKCCGMPMIMNGLFREAYNNAKRNIKSIQGALDKLQPTITTSSTCTLTIRDEYDHILGLENSEIRQSVFLATRYLFDLIDNNQIKLVFKENAGQKIIYHTSCHTEKLGWAIYSSRLLSLIPGAKLIVLDSACCGLAGTHGYKKENYQDSQAIGKTLFRKLDKLKPDIVATDCESCTAQIEMSTPYKVKNTISLIADALDEEATRKANNI